MSGRSPVLLRGAMPAAMAPGRANGLYVVVVGEDVRGPFLRGRSKQPSIPQIRLPATLSVLFYCRVSYHTSVILQHLNSGTSTPRKLQPGYAPHLGLKRHKTRRKAQHARETRGREREAAHTPPQEGPKVRGNSPTRGEPPISHTRHPLCTLRFVSM